MMHDARPAMHFSDSLTTLILLCAIYVGSFTHSVSYGNHSTALPWIEVISPSGVLIVRSDALRLLLIGHHVNKDEDWLSILDLNAPQNGEVLVPFSEEVHLNFDANVIGTIIYDVKILMGGPTANAEHNLGTPTRVFYELVWSDKVLGHAQGTIDLMGVRNHEGNDDYKRESEVSTGFSRVVTPEPEAHTSDIILDVENKNPTLQVSNTVVDPFSVVDPIRVIQIMGGNFDGQKQIMQEQWRSIDHTEVEFSVLWPCSAGLQESEGINIDGMPCAIAKHVAAALLTSPEVKIAFWETIRVPNLNMHEKPLGGLSYVEYRETIHPHESYSAEELSGNSSENLSENASENNSEKSSEDLSEASLEDSSEENRKKERKEMKGRNDESTSIQIEADVLYPYLVTRLRSTSPSRTIDKVEPMWVRLIWIQIADSLSHIFPADILVLGNGGKPVDLILPEVALALGVKIIMLDIASTAYVPHVLLEYHAVVAPSQYAAESFPYKPEEYLYMVYQQQQLWTDSSQQQQGHGQQTVQLDQQRQQREQQELQEQQQHLQLQRENSLRRERAFLSNRLIIPPGVDVPAFMGVINRGDNPYKHLNIGPRVDSDNHGNSHRNDNGDGSGLVVGFVGRLVSPKGAGMFLLMAQNVLQILPHTTFLIVGSGPLLSPLQRLSEELGVQDHVRFVGSATQPGIAALYASMDVFVTPSLMPSETFGIVNIEAMAMGVPVVSFGTYGQREYLQPIYYPHSSTCPQDTCPVTYPGSGTERNTDSGAGKSTGNSTDSCMADDSYLGTGKNSIVVTTATPTALAGGVLLLLRNKDLRAELGRNAKGTVLSDYTSTRNGRAMLMAYKAVLTSYIPDVMTR